MRLSGDDLNRIRAFDMRKLRRTQCYRVPDKCVVRQVLPTDCVDAIDQRLAARALEGVLGIVVDRMMVWIDKTTDAPHGMAWRSVCESLLKTLTVTWHDTHNDVDIMEFAMRQGSREVTGPKSYNLSMEAERRRVWNDIHDGWLANPALRLADALDLATRKLRPPDVQRSPRRMFDMRDLHHHRFFEDSFNVTVWWDNLKEELPDTTGRGGGAKNQIRRLIRRIQHDFVQDRWWSM